MNTQKIAELGFKLRRLKDHLRISRLVFGETFRNDMYHQGQDEINQDRNQYGSVQSEKTDQPVAGNQGVPEAAPMVLMK